MYRPDLSPLVWKVFKRHLLAYRKTWKVSISFNFFEPLFYLTAFGFGLGAYLKPMEGVTYIEYLAPGLIAYSAMFASTIECTYGIFVRMQYQKSYQAIVATPASIFDVVMGDMLFGAFKSVLYGTVILTVISVLGLVKSPLAVLILPVLALSGLLFSALAATWTGLVPNIDSFNYFFSLLITPMYLISGVFFPLTGLPVIIQKLAWFSPLYHLVNISRGLVTGNTGAYMAGDLAWLLVVTLIVLPAPVYLLRRLIIR